MNINALSIPLQVSAEHSARLKSLQETFALVCNALSPVVQETRCWNRVALHHMMYKTLREKFPQIGSQMVCNAIYSVSRTSRLVFQSSQSPFNIQLLGEKPLPLLQFLPSAPVYFDRHTLSLKASTLSMYTLDGRMRFELNMKEEDLNRFKTSKLHEVILKSVGDQYILSFSFASELAKAQSTSEQEAESYWPEYIVIDQLGNSSDLSVQVNSEVPPELNEASLARSLAATSSPNSRRLPIRPSQSGQVTLQVAQAGSPLLLAQALNAQSVRTKMAEPKDTTVKLATHLLSSSASTSTDALSLGIHLKLNPALSTTAAHFTTAVPLSWPEAKDAKKPLVASKTHASKPTANPVHEGSDSASAERTASLDDTSNPLIQTLGAHP